MIRLIAAAALLFSYSVGGGGAPLAAANAQQVVQGEPVSPEGLREDLAIARRALEEGHGGIYRYVSPALVATAFARAEAGINRPMTAAEFYRLLAPTLFTIQDGHLSLYLPEEAERQLRTEVPLLPLRIRFIGRVPHVATDLLSNDGRLAGFELRSVNGVGAARIVEQLLRGTRGDGAIETARLRRNEGFGFGEHLVALTGASPPYRLVLRDPSTGRTVRMKTAGEPLPSLQRRWAEAFPAQQPPASSTQFTLLDGGRIGRLSVRGFGWFTSADRKTEVQQVIADSFAEMKAKNTQALVLDLRGNSGGADELGRILLSYLTDRPFRYFADLRANRLTFSFEPYVTAGAKLLQAQRFERQPDGGYRFTDHPNAGEWEPAANAFQGPLFVLMDGGSFSTTADLLTHLHTRGRATFIGEEAGGGYYGNSSGYMSILTLPNSRLRIRLPLITYYLPAPAAHPAGRGVLPDVAVGETPADLRENRDPGFERAMSLAQRALAAIRPSEVASQSGAPPTPEAFLPVRNRIAVAVDSGALPSMSVAVVKDCRIVWSASFGLADRERGVPATPSTLYSLASVTKPMTSTVVMRLAERGLISLDAPATRYLGADAFSRAGEDVSGITVRQLLDHTAGLPEHWQFFYADEAATRRTADEALARHGFAVRPPGARFSYSNLGYSALEQIIERVTGRSYAEVMREELFRPLGMRALVSSGTGVRAARRYDEAGRPFPPYDFDHRAASAVWASAYDLSRFAQLHMGCGSGSGVLRPDSITAMRTGVNAASPYGLGWYLNPGDHGFASISHSGKMPGVFNVFVIYPSERLAVIVLTNKDEPTAHRVLTFEVAQDLTAAALPQYAAALQASRSTLPSSSTGSATRPPASDLVGSWSGRVQVDGRDIPLTLIVGPDGTMTAGFNGRAPVVLRSPAVGTTQLRGRLDGPMPSLAEAGGEQELRLDLQRDGQNLVGSLSAVAGGARPHFSLAFHVELTKTAAALLAQPPTGASGPGTAR